METTVTEPATGVLPHATSPSLGIPITSQREATSWKELTSAQKKSGLAAWLGWLFDGLDMHLYTVVALPFVAELMHIPTTDPEAGRHASWIQGSFLVGWALGGAIFGRIGDLIGRS